jgi:uncharacterized membrane protein YphA (DoxX/SURF4 family)
MASSRLQTAASFLWGLAPLLLRGGLGVLWFFAGPITAWLPHAVASAPLRSPLPFLAGPQAAAWIAWGETGIGLCLLTGFWVRGLAALQVALLGTLSVAALRVGGPGSGPGFLAQLAAMAGGAFLLAWNGGGSCALDGWIARRSGLCRLRLVWVLQWARVARVGLEEVYRVQSQAASDAHALAALDALRLDAAEHAEDLAALIRRHGGRPLPSLGLVRGCCWFGGCLTVLGGTRTALRVDHWLVGRRLVDYAQATGLLSTGDGITTRALAAMRDREAGHIRLVRDALGAAGRSGTRRQ